MFSNRLHLLLIITIIATFINECTGYSIPSGNMLEVRL